MSKSPHLSQYYADDKDIFDLLVSKTRRFDVETLLHLGRRRGICLSRKTDRDSLADYLSRLVWSSHELQHLLELGESPDRREKLTSSRVPSGASTAVVRAAIDVVKNAREQSRDESFVVKATVDTLAVSVQFAELDHSRTRLQQKITREVTLEFEKTEGGFTLRHQANERAREIGRDILKQVEQTTQKAATAETITLRGVRAPELRTLFFMDLMEKLPGLTLRNVTSVSVFRALSDMEATDNGDDNQDDEESGSEEAALMLGVVRKAVFDGESLLDSAEFGRLRAEGFYLSRAVWRARDSGKAEAADIEFEADFEDTLHCDGFRYDVRGMYERRSRGEEGLRKTRSPVPGDVRAGLLDAVWKSAQTALQTVVDKAGGDSGKETADGRL